MFKLLWCRKKSLMSNYNFILIFHYGNERGFSLDLRVMCSWRDYTKANGNAHVLRLRGEKAGYQSTWS